MLSLEKMRELIPNSDDLTDEFLEELRSEMYAMAELALECYFKNKNGEMKLNHLLDR